MPIVNNTYFTWVTNYAYSKWDVVYGAFGGDTRYFYSTKDNNDSAYPLGQYVYTPTQTTRRGNVCRTSFTQTGSIYFQPGSVVAVSNISPDSTCNYTGVVLAAGPGYVEYLNPGLDVSNSTSAGTVRAPIHPYWTTGFYWIPSWSTDVTHEQQVIVAAMGEGYSQRTNPAINANTMTWNLVFDERTDKEAASLINFVQNHGGVTPFNMPFPVGNLYNNPNLKYVAGTARHRLSSYGLNSITVPVAQVFDI